MKASRGLLSGVLAFAIALCCASVSNGQPYCAPPKPPGAPPVPERPKPACDPWDCAKCCKSPTAIASGAYVRDDRDLSIKTAAGFPLLVNRHYDSSRPIDGPMGVGWSSNLNVRVFYAAYLQSAPATYSYEADVQMPTGNIYRFTLNGSTWTPPTGRREKLVRNADGSFTMTLEDGRSIYQFGTDGNLTSMADEYGNTLQYTYSAGRLQRVADMSGSGRYLDVTWLNGRISYVTDSTGRQVKYTYASDGTLASVADPVAAAANEQSAYYTYEPGRFAPVLTLIKDRWQRVISDLTWDSSFRLRTYTDGTYNTVTPSDSTGERYQYDYFPDNAPPYTSKSHSLGAHQYFYDALGLVNDRTVYDANGRLTQTLDSLGNGTTYTYDSQGRLISRSIAPSTYAEGVTWSYSYDVNFPEKVVSVTSNQATKYAGWKYAYYAPGSVAPGALQTVSRVRSDGLTADLVTSYAYDNRGRITYVGSVDEGETYYAYDAAGNMQSVTGSHSTTFSYDSLGRVATATDALSHATAYTYDANDRVLTVTLPKPASQSTLNFTTSYSYDNYDSATTLVFVNITDPNARITRQGYDALGHLVKSTDARGYTTTYAYQYDLLKSVTDANGNKTTYSYDNERNLSATTFPDGAVEQYSRAVDGRLLSMTDRKGVQAVYSYDSQGRTRSVSYAGQTWPDGSSKAISYSYDGERLTSVADRLQSATASYSFTYDSSGRLQQEGLVGGHSVSYTYANTATSLISSYTLSPPVGNNDRSSTVSYVRDGFGRINYMTWTGVTGSFHITYDLVGRYDQIEFPNGQLRDFSYDDQGRLTEVWNSKAAGAGTTARFTYAYDHDWATDTDTMLGQRTSVTVVADANAHQAGGTTRYYYDAGYQLNRTDYPNGQWQKWEYDGIGNRTKIENGTGTTTTSSFDYTYYRYPANPNADSQRVKNYGYGDVSYDANGNTSSHHSGTLVWDVANRLVSGSGGSYTYDYASRRVSRSSPQTTYLYQGQNLIRQRTTTPVQVLDDFIFGPGIDEPLARRDVNGNVTYYSVDGPGSVVAESNASGSVVDFARYSPWGEAQEGQTEPFAYTGREQGPPGLFYRARYYEPLAGRFVSEDPFKMAYRAHAAQSGRRVRFESDFVYALDNPIRYRDPLGLVPSPICVANWTLLIGFMGAMTGAVSVGAGGGSVSFGVAAIPAGVLGAAVGGAAGAAIGNAIGQSICPDQKSCPIAYSPPNPLSERCKGVKEQCIAKCSDETLPTGDPGGWPFFNCLNKCMQDNGC